MPIIGVTIFVLFLCLAISIDMSRTHLARSKAMAALDSAVLAAAAEVGNANTNDPAEIQKVIAAKAREYLIANFPPGYLGVTYGLEQPIIYYDAGTQRVSGELAVNIPMLFGSFHSTDALASGGTNEVQREGTSLRVEVALVLDITPSMCQPQNSSGGGAPDGCTGTGPELFAFAQDCTGKPGTRIDSLRDALTVFHDRIGDAANSASQAGLVSPVYIGAIFFDSYFKVEKGTSDLIQRDSVNLNPLRYDGSYGLYKYWDDGLPASVGLKPVEESLTPILEKIDDMPDSWVPFMQCPAETQTQVGTWGGLMLLDPSAASYFNHVKRPEDTAKDVPSAFGNPDAIKVLVLMTDGSNTRWVWDASADNFAPANDPEADARQLEYCETLKNQAGFVVYSIVFGNPSGDIKDIFRQCASNNGNGYYFEPDNGDELQAAFSNIADSVINLRITK